LSDVAVTDEDAAPAQSCQQAFRPRVVGPELGQVGTRLYGALLEGGKEAVGMTAMAFLRQDDYIDQVGNATPEPEPQASDPVADLVTENQVAFIEHARPPARILFLLENLREPGREVLVLLHVANCQLAHLPRPPEGRLPSRRKQH
jgi:hypothetical protein